MTDIAALLRNRWSPRVFDPHHTVTDDEVRLLLEAARWAPSGRNEQPWSFLVGRRGDRLRARIDRCVAGRSDWALDASLLVVNLYQAGASAVDLALYDLGGAVAHMTLQGEALGLHARQFATFDRAALRREFAITPPHAAVTITAFGRVPAGVGPGERVRREVDSLLWPTP